MTRLFSEIPELQDAIYELVQSALDDQTYDLDINGGRRFYEPGEINQIYLRAAALQHIYGIAPNDVSDDLRHAQEMFEALRAMTPDYS